MTMPESLNGVASEYIRCDLCITRAEAETMVLAERERCVQIVQDRADFYARKRDACETEIDMHWTLIHTVEAHEYAIDAIRGEPKP